MINLSSTITSTSSTILLRVKTINSSIIEIKIAKTATIKELKEQLSPKVNLEPMKQKLIFHGKILADSSPLTEYKLESNDVVHLVECIPPSSQSSQSNTNLGNRRNNNANNDNNPDDFLDLLQVLSNSMTSQHNLLTLVLGQDFLNNIISEVQISDSFQQLLKRTNYNRSDSIESLSQNFNNIYALLDNVINCDPKKNSTVNQLFKLSNTAQNIRFQVGQWVDAYDAFQHWGEAQIIDIRANRAHLHFFGWSSDLNEWISLNSPRIAIFRTHTIQSPFSRFYSPYPNKKDPTNLTSNTTQFFDRMGNMKDIIHFLDVLKERTSMVLEEKNLIETNQFSYVKEEQDRERQKMLLIMQLYPLMDRIGRILIDYAAYLMNYSFNYFENHPALFKDNVKNIPRSNNTSFNNRNNNNPDEVLRKTLYQFEELNQLGAMRNPGEMAETFRLIRPNGINLRGPASIQQSNEAGANFQRQFQRFNGNPGPTNNINTNEQPSISITNNRIVNQQETARQQNQGQVNGRNQIDYLNQVQFQGRHRRFDQNSLNVIHQEKITYVIYNKYAKRTFDAFTQTFDEKSKLVIAPMITVEVLQGSNNDFRGVLSKSINGKLNKVSSKKEKVTIIAQPKLAPLNSHSKQLSNQQIVSKSVNSNKYRVYLASNRK